MQCIALFIKRNTNYDTGYQMIRTVYPSQKKLLNDLWTHLCKLSGPFKDFQPHPDDHYAILPLCIKDNEVCNLKGKPISPENSLVHSFSAAEIFKWNMPIEKVRERYLSSNPDELRLQASLSKEFYRQFEQFNEHDDWVTRVHFFGHWIVGLLKVGLPALIEDMKKDQDERRKLFAGADQYEVVAPENNDAAAE